MTEHRFRLATQKAEKFLANHGIDRLPIDPFKIARDLEIDIQSKPDTVAGVSGMLLRHGDRYGILYATHVDSEGFQRFSVAHELAHFLLDGHIDHVLPPHTNTHTSHAGFISRDPYELEADYFAAGLLMPDPMFSRELVRAGDGLEAIEVLAGRCRTSLTATAIRYVEKTPAPVAVVMSTAGRIDYCFMSASLREFEGLSWPRKDEPLPPGVETGRFGGNPANVVNSRRAEVETNLRDWFGGRRSVEASEEIIGLGSYERILTIICASEFADEGEEEEDLSERWTPRFRR